MDHLRAITDFVGGDSPQTLTENAILFHSEYFPNAHLNCKGYCTLHVVDSADTVLLQFSLVLSKTMKSLQKIRAVYACKINCPVDLGGQPGVVWRITLIPVPTVFICLVQT